VITNLVSRRSESPVAPATGSGRVIPARVRPQTSQTYYHRNQQYSIVGLTNATGTLVERYTYSAYGTLGIYAANGTVRSSSTYANRYTCTGREWDGELRLYHFRARWYDPATGGFVTRDPLGYVDGISLYRGYFGVKVVDPWGLWTWEIGPNGEVFAVSEENDTLAGLIGLGYDPEKLKLISNRPFSESLPAGTKIDITTLFPEVVGQVIQHQERMLVSRELLSDYLTRFGFPWWDPENGVEDRAEENWPTDKDLIAIARGAETGQKTTGELGFYKVYPSAIISYRGQCYDFAAIVLGIFSPKEAEEGVDPWDCAFRYDPHFAPVLKNGRVPTRIPKFMSLLLVMQGDLGVHAGIVLGTDGKGRHYVLCRRGGGKPIAVDVTEPFRYPGYDGVVEYYDLQQ
jgi:RHS repeat-associated protein